MLTIKRSQSVTVEHEFCASDLVDKFTDDELRTVGLFRDLRDADIARAHKLEQERRRELARCEDDDCECVIHQGPMSRFVKKPSSQPLKESDFWALLRIHVQRGHAEEMVREIETRAWECGGITVDLSRIFTKGS